MPVFRDSETVECWKGPESQPKRGTANKNVLRNTTQRSPKKSPRLAYLVRDEFSDLTNHILNHVGDRR